MANGMPDRECLDRARHQIDTGDCKIAYEILLPLISQKNPEALFLYSMFSISDTETEDAYERRSLALLKEASDLGFPAAMYTLGVYYDQGDFVKRDPLIASQLIKRAAEAGYSPAKLSHGLDLLHGSNGIEKNEELGLDFIQQAMMEREDDVEDSFHHFTQK